MAVDYISLDPGATIGIASLASNVDYRSFQLEPNKFPHPHEMLFDVLSEFQPKAIIYEAFHHRQGQLGAVFVGVEYIGVIELYGQLKCIEIIKVTPSTGKAFWNDAKLKALGLYRPGKPHANDAMRILLYHRMAVDLIWRDEILLVLKDKL